MYRPSIIFLALIVMGGCGLLRERVTDPFRAPEERAVLVLVENHHREDVIIEAMTAGRRETLGRVSARSRGQFQLDWRERGELQLRIQLVAGPRHTTRGLSVGAGDRVELFVQAPLSRSVVRRR